jgi:hypothetical protein
MIACSNEKSCPVQWFHKECVKLDNFSEEEIEKMIWFCGVEC